MANILADFTNFLTYFLFAPMNPREVILFFVVVFGMVISFIMLTKLGAEGRFFLRDNLFRKGGATLLYMYNTGRLVIEHVRSQGNMLKIRKKVYVLLPQILNILHEYKAITNTSDSEEVRKKYNEILQSTTNLNKRPVYLATEHHGIAVNVPLVEAIKNAETIKDENTKKAVESFINGLHTAFKNDTPKRIEIVQPIELDLVSEYLSLSINENDSKQIFDAGQVAAASLLNENSRIFLIIIIILIAALVISMFMK